jgi:hypothetical protein
MFSCLSEKYPKNDSHNHLLIQKVFLVELLPDCTYDNNISSHPVIILYFFKNKTKQILILKPTMLEIVKIATVFLLKIY